MDYIVPAVCSETEFRTMWAEFEWENKVGVDSRGSRVGQMFCKNTRYSKSDLLLSDIGLKTNP